MKKSASLVRRQRGLATVEMAFVTPVLLIILLVTFEFTRAFYEQNTLTKSVRDAARQLSLNAFKGDFYEITDEEVRKAINLVVYGKFVDNDKIGVDDEPLVDELNRTDVIVERDPEVYSGVTLLEHVQVSVSFDFQPEWPIISGMNFLPNDVDISPNSPSTVLTLTATSTMRALK